MTKNRNNKLYYILKISEHLNMGLYDDDDNKLPHFTNIPQAAQLDDPIFTSLFEVNFILPIALREEGRDPRMLLYSAQNITFPLTPTLPTVNQRYKYSTRPYIGLPESTHLDDISIDFAVNQDDRLSVYVWNTLKAWYDLAWNSQTGEVNYHRDLVGTIIANQHDKPGNVIRRVIYHNAALKGINEVALNWANTSEIYQAQASFVVSHWDDIYNDVV